MSETITVTGLRETQKALYSYSQQLGDKVVLSSLRLGANLVKRVAQSNAPVRTGNLRRGIRVARSRIHRGQFSSSMIGVYISLRKGKDGPFYGKFIEDGWVPGKRRNRSAGQRRIEGKHFIDHAFESTKESALQLIIESAQAGAEVLAKKTGL